MMEQVKHRLYRTLELGLLEENSDWIWSLQELSKYNDLAAQQYMQLLSVLALIKEQGHFLRDTLVFPKMVRGKGNTPHLSGSPPAGVMVAEGTPFDLGRMRFLRKVQGILTKAIGMSRPDFSLEQSISTMGPDRIELYLLNLLGLFHLYAGELWEAVHLLGGLMTVIRERSRNQIPQSRLLAAAEGNLALCYACKGVYEFAIRYSREAVHNARKEGGALFLARILRIHMEIAKAMGEEEVACRDRDSIHGICHMMSEGEARLDERDIMEGALGIFIL